MNYFIIFYGSFTKKIYCVDEENKDKILEGWRNNRNLEFSCLNLPSKSNSFVGIKAANISMIEVRAAN